MKHELDRMMSIIKDYETGYGGVTDSFLRKELEMFAKDYHKEQCSIANVAGHTEQLVCEYCNEDAKPTCCDSCLESMVNAVQKAN